MLLNVKANSPLFLKRWLLRKPVDGALRHNNNKCLTNWLSIYESRQRTTFCCLIMIIVTLILKMLPPPWRRGSKKPIPNHHHHHQERPRSINPSSMRATTIIMSRTPLLPNPTRITTRIPSQPPTTSNWSTFELANCWHFVWSSLSAFITDCCIYITESHHAKDWLSMGHSKEICGNRGDAWCTPTKREMPKGKVQGVPLIYWHWNIICRLS